MWALSLKQKDPMAASATAAYMHLAALAREAHERHPSAGSPQETSPHKSEHELGALCPSAGLKWVADGVGQWADRELAPLDRALASSISHAAVNLRTLAGLVHETPR